MTKDQDCLMTERSHFAVDTVADKRKQSIVEDEAEGSFVRGIAVADPRTQNLQAMASAVLH